MAPLYKRYIPPKSSTPSNPAPPTPAVKNVHDSTPQDEPKKRKRERTEDEIAERKAKKLKKKGIDPATVLPAETPKLQPQKQIPTTTANDAAPAPTNAVSLESEEAQQPGGEFSHIKNAKKRHKLEKEARKGRIAAEKAQQKVNGGAVGIQNGRGERVLGHDEESRELASEDTPVGSVKRKKRRGGDGKTRIKETEDVALLKSRSQELTIDEAENPGADERVEDGGGDQKNDQPLSQPKKRRHKLESVLRHPEAQQSQGQGEDDDRQHLEKHSKILSKFQKSAALSQSGPHLEPPTSNKEPEPVILDLAPLPQPAKIPTPDFVPEASSALLPAWIAKPTIISNDSKATFSSLQLDAPTVQHLSSLGFDSALPVQQALIPLLLPPGSRGARYLPGTESVVPDLAVGAPTGSGKTIAYLLPILEALKKTAGSGSGRLKAVVVVPTRELVVQVASVAETLLPKGSSGGVRIGMASGTVALREEQARLIKRGRKYDPEGYEELMWKAHVANYPPPPTEDDNARQEEEDHYHHQQQQQQRIIQDAVTGSLPPLVDHIPTYASAVDILVATPGRLLEHLSSTLGFTLEHLEWLVLDEADKLLDLQYDGFLETVNERLSEAKQDARRERGRVTVRKVVLSATMTRDVEKLVKLGLRRPGMVVVRGGDEDHERDSGEQGVKEAGAGDGEGGFELPRTLREFCVPVGDGSEKPLFLVEVLERWVLCSPGQGSERREGEGGGEEEDEEGDDDMVSEASSSEDSEGSKPLSSSSSDDDDDQSSAEDVEDNINGDATHNIPPEEEGPEEPSSIHPSRAAMLLQTTTPPPPPTILIFTSSNESAQRLAHLLSALKPTWSQYIHTLTKNTKTPTGSSPTDPIIAISTDRAARGLDALGTRPITHVLSYDIPRSRTGYVHRVGRTARAGKGGEAWTLYQAGFEARLFVKEVVGGRGKGLKRFGEVEKVKVKVTDEELRERFAGVVEGMREDVFGKARKG